MLKPKNARGFKRDLKRFVHHKSLMKELRNVIEQLLAEKTLEEKHCDHPLTGNWIGHRECHVKPDVVLIYKTNEDTLFLERLGSHSELFN